MKSTRTIIVTITMLIFLAGLWAGCGGPTQNNSNSTPMVANKATPTPSPAACDDAQVKKDVGDAFKAQSDIWAERKTINYFSKGCVVHLQGWVLTLALYQKVIGVASKVNGVKGLDVSKFALTVGNQPGACPADMKPCGDICIPNEDQCNIEAGTGVGSGTPQPTASRTP
jgi:hypothetical protein